MSRVADGVIEHFALVELELLDENLALQRERDEALIDREVFRAWMTEWAPTFIASLIALQREIFVLARTNRDLRAENRRLEDDYRRLRERVMCTDGVAA